ncbi:MAG: beta-ketoacyl-ACP synthase III [Caulobacter sp.]|nr:beta-ketoacyl-ACP synthase III [Caulobacter sp.]
MTREAYITGVAEFLPGPPIDNDGMEDHLGRVGGRDSVFGRRALRWNGIETRHYALDHRGRSSHSNASMCAAAVRGALDDAGLGLEELQFLAAATTQGDLLVPGHASQVQGSLGAGPMEIASFQSVCASALMAAKSAWLMIKAGEHDRAVACAGEFSSRWFRPSFYDGGDLVDAKGRLHPEADFLRFTLSDGAGAIVIEPQPKPDGLSLRIRSMELTSLAGAFGPCMWAGAVEGDRDLAEGGWSLAGPMASHAAGAIPLQQDFTLLKKIIRAWIGVYLQRVDEGSIVPDDVDHLLCHYSARSIRQEIVDLLRNTRGMIPEERWFSVLSEVGNVGSASIWIMLSRLMRSGKLLKGQTVLCIVPESGRAMVGFILLEVV